MNAKTFVTLSAAMLLALSSTALADKPVGNDTWKGNSLLVPPHAKYGGKTQSEWAKEYWFWEASILGTWEDFPGYDVSGKNLNVNQEGPVFFLPVSWNWSLTDSVVEQRSAQVPAGKALYIIFDGAHFIINGYPSEPPAGFDPNKFTDWAFGLIASWAPYDFKLEIDGQAVPIDSRLNSPYLVSSGIFALPVPEGSAYRAAEYPNMSAVINPFLEIVFSVIVKPLPVGEHTIRIRVADSDLQLLSEHGLAHHGDAVSGGSKRNSRVG